MNKELLKEIKASRIVVKSGRYAYLKATESLGVSGHFLVSQDNDEVTVVTKEENLETVDYSDEVKWFKLCEVKVSKPFLVKGFLAAITSAVADVDLNVLVVSTFSKDYILVREETASKAVKALEDLGFSVKWEEA